MVMGENISTKYIIKMKHYSKAFLILLLFDIESRILQPTDAFIPASIKIGSVCKPSLRTVINLQEKKDNGQFVNDGMLAGLQPFLKLFGFEDGKQMILAVPTSKKEGDAPLVTDDVASERRRKAALDLINIGPDERERRAKAGKIFLYISAFYAFVTAVVLDEGDINGHILRFSVILPFFFGYAFKQSAKFGL